MLIEATQLRALSGFSAASTQAARDVQRVADADRVPSFRDSASTAGIAVRTQSSKLERLAEIHSAQRAEALLEVTLAATGSISNVLKEMRGLALTLADTTIAGQERAELTNRYLNLSEQIDEIAEMATLDGRSLINGALPEEGGGDLVLADGTRIAAVDMRRAGSINTVLDPPGGEFIRPAFSENIIAAIPFEDGGGGTADPLDWTINSPSATLVNGAGWGTTDAGDGAVALPGATVGGTNSPHVKVENLDFGNEVTFAFNIKVDNLDDIRDNGFMAFWETGSFANRVVLRTNNATGDTFLLANVKDGVWTGVTGGPSFPQGRWVHLAGTIAADGTTALYMDGVQIVEGMTQPLADKPREEVRVGATMYASQGAVQGGIGDLVVYNRAFDPGEANLLYQASTGGVERWAPTGSASNWQHAVAEAEGAIGRLAAAEAQFASIAKSLTRKAELNQQLADVMDKSIASIVDFDAGASKARLEAAKVREELAITMVTQRSGIMGSALSLFSNALNAKSQMDFDWRFAF